MKLTNNLKIVKNNFKNSLPSHLKDLNARSKVIFSLIVNDFLKTGNPVGSRKLSFKMGEQLSPASIRNVMYDLQESGLLKSNHTSSGRVPTDLGLRFFVDGLLQVGKLKNNECKEIKNTINISNSDKDNKDMIIKLALETDNIKKFLNNTEPKKIISVPGKVVNIVV